MDRPHLPFDRIPNDWNAANCKVHLLFENDYPWHSTVCGMRLDCLVEKPEHVASWKRETVTCSACKM